MADYNSLKRRKLAETRYSHLVPSLRPKSPFGLYPIPPRVKLPLRFRTLYPENGSLTHKGTHNPTFKKKRDIEGRLETLVIIASLFTAALFISSNLTGLAISNLKQFDTNVIGAFFFLFGLASLFVKIKKK